MTRTPEEIIRMITEIQDRAGLKVDMLVNNANVLGESTPDLLAEASRILKLSAPVVHTRRVHQRHGGSFVAV